MTACRRCAVRRTPDRALVLVNFVRAAKPLRGFVFFVSFVKRRSRLVVRRIGEKRKGGP